MFAATGVGVGPDRAGRYCVGCRAPWAAAILARMRFSASPLQYLQSRRMKTEL